MTPITTYALPGGRATWGLGVERGALILVEKHEGEWLQLASFPIPREKIEAFLRDVVVPKANELLQKRVAEDRTAELGQRLPRAIVLTAAGFDYQRPTP